jgi:hypothetical protein
MGNALGFVALGIFIGLLMLDNKNNYDVLYFTGRWKFKSCKYAVFLALTFIIIGGIPGALIGVGIPLIIDDPVGGFVCIAVAATWACFVLVYMLSKIQNKFGWIEYHKF